MCSALCRILKLRWRSTLDAEGTYWDVAERDNKTRVTWWSVLLGTSKVYFTFFKTDFDLGCYMLLLYPLLWSWFGQGNFSCGNFTWRLCKGPIECGSKELCHVFFTFAMCFSDLQPMLHGYTWRFDRIVRLCVFNCFHVLDKTQLFTWQSRSCKWQDFGSEDRRASIEAFDRYVLHPKQLQTDAAYAAQQRGQNRRWQRQDARLKSCSNYMS